MRVFVAGATGVIGRSLVSELIAAGHQVSGISRSQARVDALRERGVEAVRCDALDPAALRETVVSTNPDAVVHALTDIPANLQPRGFRRQLASTNRLRREGTRNLIDAAQQAGAHRLAVESIAFVYEPTGDWVKSETAPLALSAGPPTDAVVGAIADLEQQTLAADGVVLRFGFLYGPGTQFAHDGMYAKMVQRRMFPLIGSGEGHWSFIHPDDAASATVAALERAGTGIYNIVDDEPAPVKEWLPVYAAAVGAPRPLRVPAWLGRAVGGPAGIAAMTTQRGASNAKAKRELGWQPRYVSWRDGFRTATG